MVGTPLGALFTSSEFMSLGPTSAMMLTVGTALAAYSADTALTAMVTLTLLVGIFMLVMGLLKLGSITRFISNAVMVGFLTGLAVLIILGQLGNLNALKHGFYSMQFQKSELSELEEAGDLQEEIGMMRVVTRRLLEMARGCKDMG